MNQWATRVVGAAAIAVGLVAGGVAACGHGGGDSDTANEAKTPQPTEDQLWAFADEMAAHAPHATSDQIDSISGGGSDDGGTAGGDQGAAAAAPAGWSTLSSDPCGFTVNMPGDKPPADDPNTGDATHQYRDPIPGEPDGAYVVSCTDFGKANTDVKGWLDNAQKKLAAKGTITGSSDVTLAGNPGREVHLDINGGAAKAVARIYWVKTRSIVAMVAMESKLYNDKDASAFLDSLRLNP